MGVIIVLGVIFVLVVIGVLAGGVEIRGPLDFAEALVAAFAVLSDLAEMLLP